MSPALPAIPELASILRRLRVVFPEGIENRGWLTRELAAKTVFVMLYTGAVENSGRWLRPNQVTRMTDVQAGIRDDTTRLAWTTNSLKPLKDSIPHRWFADTTREPIRDETLRAALQPLGAVIERSDLPISSASPRWALAADFAELFQVPDAEFEEAAAGWREKHLSAAARARLAIVQRGVVEGQSGEVSVAFPNGEVRRLPHGPSSDITKSVIEDFAPAFLTKPGVIWVSDSRNHVVARDDALARSVGFNIVGNKLLPDIVLVDVGARDLLFVFVEVVATDGPVTDLRRDQLAELVTNAGLRSEHATYVSAFHDRGSAVYRRNASVLAWGSFVWFASEPATLIALIDPLESSVRLDDVMGLFRPVKY